MPKRKTFDADTNALDPITVKNRPSRKLKPVSFFINESTKDNEKDGISRVRRIQVEEYNAMQPIPLVNKFGEICFLDYPDFKPNMTPKEVIQAGSFGGTYFRSIYSAITKKNYSDVWKEFPEDWFEGLVASKTVARVAYDNNINAYKVSYQLYIICLKERILYHD